MHIKNCIGLYRIVLDKVILEDLLKLPMGHNSLEIRTLFFFKQLKIKSSSNCPILPAGMIQSNTHLLITLSSLKKKAKYALTLTLYQTTKIWTGPN